MEDSIAHDEANSRSGSEKGISDTNQKQRGSGITASPESNDNQEDSTTPTANPPQGSQQQFTMAPPPRPSFKATPTSAQPSKLVSQASSQHQPAASSKHPANDKTHATPRKRSHVEVDQEPTAHDQECTDEDTEPADQMATFDWRELEQRYHDRMEQYAAQEQDLYQSFHELCKVTSFSPQRPSLLTDHSTSTSGPRPDTPTRLSEALNGNAHHGNHSIPTQSTDTPPE